MVDVVGVYPNLQVLRGGRRGLSIPRTISGFDRHSRAREVAQG